MRLPSPVLSLGSKVIFVHSLSAGRYLSEKFAALDRKKDRGRPFYCHFTCATDTTQVKVVIGAVMDSVIQGLLSEVSVFVVGRGEEWELMRRQRSG